jgi:hypothetical protein
LKPPTAAGGYPVRVSANNPMYPGVRWRNRD